MECIICRNTVVRDEDVFWLSIMICCGPGDHEYRLTVDPESTAQVIHVRCLESSGEAEEIVNETILVHDDEVSVVERSDALSLLMGIE